MDCRISLDEFRSKFVSDETFTGPDGLTYNKVKVTSGWNHIQINGFLDQNNSYGYFDYYIPVKSYSDIELFTEICNVIKQFCIDYSNKSGYTLTYNGLTKQNNFVINNQELYNDYLNENILQENTINNVINYTFNGVLDDEKMIIIFSICENGLDQILPFTLPVPIFDITSNPDGFQFSPYVNTVTVTNNITFLYSNIFFKYIWLNDNFIIDNDYNKGLFYDNNDYTHYNYYIQYNNLPTGLKILGNNDNALDFILPCIKSNGYFTSYGYLFNIICSINYFFNTSNYFMYLPYLNNDKLLIFVYNDLPFYNLFYDNEYNYIENNNQIIIQEINIKSPFISNKHNKIILPNYYALSLLQNYPIFSKYILYKSNLKENVTFDKSDFISLKYNSTDKCICCDNYDNTLFDLVTVDSFNINIYIGIEDIDNTFILNLTIISTNNYFYVYQPVYKATNGQSIKIFKENSIGPNGGLISIIMFTGVIYNLKFIMNNYITTEPLIYGDLNEGQFNYNDLITSPLYLHEHCFVNNLFLNSLTLSYFNLFSITTSDYYYRYFYYAGLDIYIPNEDDMYDINYATIKGTIYLPSKVENVVIYPRISIPSTTDNIIIYPDTSAEYTCSLIGGELPEGLILNPDGTIVNTSNEIKYNNNDVHPYPIIQCSSSLGITSTECHIAIYDVMTDLYSSEYTCKLYDEINLFPSNMLLKYFRQYYNYTFSSDDLPEGLTLNPLTGNIYGTIGDNCDFNVKCEMIYNNFLASASVIVSENIKINVKGIKENVYLVDNIFNYEIIKPNLPLKYNNTIIPVYNMYYTYIKPVNNVAIEYTITGDLPEGINFNSSTGEISGIYTGSNNDIINVTISANNQSTELMIVEHYKNHEIQQYTYNKYYYYNSLPFVITPNQYSSDIIYQLYTDLPDGVSFDSSTGVITVSKLPNDTINIKTTVNNNEYYNNIQLYEYKYDSEDYYTAYCNYNVYLSNNNEIMIHVNNDTYLQEGDYNEYSFNNDYKGILLHILPAFSNINLDIDFDKNIDCEIYQTTPLCFVNNLQSNIKNSTYIFQKDDSNGNNIVSTTPCQMLPLQQIINVWNSYCEEKLYITSNQYQIIIHNPILITLPSTNNQYIGEYTDSDNNKYRLIIENSQNICIYNNNIISLSFDETNYISSSYTNVNGIDFHYNNQSEIPLYFWIKITQPVNIRINKAIVIDANIEYQDYNEDETYEIDYSHYEEMSFIKSIYNYNINYPIYTAINVSAGINVDKLTGTISALIAPFGINKVYISTLSNPAYAKKITLEIMV